MNELFSIFDKLKSTTSRNEKERILRENKDNQEFLIGIKFLLDDFTKTGISNKKINKKFPNITEELSKDITDLKDLLLYISKNNTGTDKDIKIVQSFILRNEKFAEDIKGLITKSTRLGVTAKTLNKVVPNSVREFGCILAESYDKNKNRVKGKDFIITTKLDGTRMLAIVEDGNCTCFSRQGQEIEGLIEIVPELNKLPNGVYDGELLANLKNNDFIALNLDSKDIFNETIKRSRIKGNKTGLKFVVYDYIENLNDFYNGRSNETCLDRKNKLKNILKHGNLVTYLEPLYIGNDISMIKKHLIEQVAKGEEGIMINILNAPYECKRVKTLLKVKRFSDADVKVIDIIEGDGRNKNKLGAITIQFKHEDTLYECNVGSGFSDKERIDFWNNPEKILNKIVTVQYFEITRNDDGGYGMRFPTWLGIIRDDKTEISMY